jgi:hypothetical protein
MRKRLLGLILLGEWLISGSVFAQAPRATTSGRAPTHVFVVTKPSLISSFVVTQAEVDSSGDVNEALSDYQYYMSLAMPVLKRHGIQVHLTNDSTLRWRDSLGVHSIAAADSGGIVYLFVSPNGHKRILRQGVELDGAILAAARGQFGLPIPVPEGEGDEP